MLLPEWNVSRGLKAVIWPAVVACIMGAVAFAAFRDLGPVPFQVQRAAWVQKTPVASTAPDILLGAPINDGAKDKLYVFDPQSQTVKEKSVPAGWRTNDMQNRDIKVQMPDNRSGTVTLITADGTKIPLQTADGQSYQNAVVVGGLDAQHTAVVAKGNEQDLLSVDPSGQVNKIATVPDNANPLAAGQGSAWFSTYQPCGGIEDAPRGPSSLIRVNADGTTSTVATSPERVITSVLSGPDNALAYTLDDGQTIVRSGNLQWSGNGKPLLWQDAQDLLIGSGTTLQRLNLQDGTLTVLTTLPEAPSMATVNH